MCRGMLGVSSGVKRRPIAVPRACESIDGKSQRGGSRRAQRTTSSAHGFTVQVRRLGKGSRHLPDARTRVGLWKGSPEAKGLAEVG